MASPTHSANEPTQGAFAIGDRLDELKRDLGRLSERVQHYVQNRAAGLKDTAMEKTDEFQELIRGNPLPAIGIAFGAGFVVGLLVGGGSRGLQPPRVSRRDIDRLASSLATTLAIGRGPARRAASEAARMAETTEHHDSAILERLAGALSSLLATSKETAATVGSAGESTARTVAAMGEKAAKTIAERISPASWR